ncbi:MAG: hypothetical protein ACRETT_13825, partial [Steroidobacteraceae bacterium]
DRTAPLAVSSEPVSTALPASPVHTQFCRAAQSPTDDVLEGNDTQLPAAFGGAGASYSPLLKGRVVGLELGYRL